MPGLRDIRFRKLLEDATREYEDSASHDRQGDIFAARRWLDDHSPELAALVLHGEDVIAGLMEIAEIAMPDSYFEDDSRTTAARLWLARLSRLGAGDSNPRHGPGRGQNEKGQT